MTFQKQLQTLKDNWLIAALLILGLLFMNSGGVGTFSKSFSGGVAESAMDMAYSRVSAPMPPSYGGSFNPAAKERKITKNANIRNEVEQGTFDSSEKRVKSAILNTKSILLNENVYTTEAGWKQSRQGSYQIKVPINQYEILIGELRSIGEVKSFSESQDDITVQYEDASLTLDAEKARLERYKTMYKEATRMEDKITLNDRIFEQERTIKYLEESLKNVNERVDYSTVFAEIAEKQPKYSTITFVKLSELVKTFVDNLNGVLTMLFSAIPWAIAGLIGYGIWKIAKKKL